jgi:hypothetical protein
MKRAEHLAGCKARALEFLGAGNLQDAVASMVSDLRKHPETAARNSPLLVMVAMRYVMQADVAAVRRWIEGFR